MDKVNGVTGPVRPLPEGAPPAPDGMQTLGAFVQALGTLGRQQAEPSSPGGGAVASAPPEVAAAFLARPTYNFDRTRVSTASDTLGETKGVTDSQLILDKNDTGRAQESVRAELGRQDGAQNDSENRAEQARATLGQSRGREQQLANQRRELQTVQTSRSADAQESNRQVMSDAERLEQHTRSIEATQNAGEQSLSRINQLDGQVQQNAAARDQASNDVRSSQQSIASLQNQVQQLQRPPASAPGKSEDAGSSAAAGGPGGPGGPPPPKNSTWAQAQQQQKKTEEAARAAAQQQALSSAQTQLASAQKQQDDARKRQEQAQQQLQTNQQAASGERKNLEQTRGQLDRSLQARRTSQDRAQSNKQQMQVDADQLKDLASHTRDLNGQADEIEAGRERAQVSLEKNQANASAAKQNVAQLRALSSEFEPGPDPVASETAGRPGLGLGEKRKSEAVSEPVPSLDSGLNVRGEALASRPSAEGASRSGPGPEVQDQGKKLFVRLASLNQGANGASIDSSGGLTRHRSGSGSGEAAADASLAAAAAAAAPGNGPSSSSSSETLRSGPPGLEKKGGDDDGGRGRGNGGGKGRG